MTLFWVVLLILLVYALIIRPLTRNRYPQPPYGPGPHYGPGYTPPAGVFNGMGMFAGGLAAGALLTYLLEQGRISAEQFDYFRSLDDEQAIRELQEQNIIQQHEIDDLMQRVNEGVGAHDLDAADGGAFDDSGYADDYGSNGYDAGGFDGVGDDWV
ncbi:hypothetical protein [Effusibacillus pohliae]|uniref:hypothetical protein n=1 Tax=Effusibacillus pohliae TaxID=232270 RepID=UPI00036B9719|nr:hypothetical protein [Effusibacillus pohliae]